MTGERMEQPLLKCLRRDAFLLCYQHQRPAKKLLVLVTNRGFLAVLLYRLSHHAWRLKVPIVPLLLTRVSQTLFAVDIAYQARLGPGIVITHGVGTVIGSETIIAGDCRIFHGVTFGVRGSEWIGSPQADGHPHVEANCMFAAGAKVLGPIRIGRNSVIGANAVVTKDVPASAIVAGNPARIIGQRPEMDERLRRVHPWTEEEVARAREKRQLLDEQRKASGHGHS
jgi:serine O-acetyltransferase